MFAYIKLVGLMPGASHCHCSMVKMRQRRSFSTIRRINARIQIEGESSSKLVAGCSKMAFPPERLTRIMSHRALRSKVEPILTCSISLHPRWSNPQGWLRLRRGRGPLTRQSFTSKTRLRTADQVSHGGPHNMAAMLPLTAAL